MQRSFTTTTSSNLVSSSSSVSVSAPPTQGTPPPSSSSSSSRSRSSAFVACISHPRFLVLTLLTLTLIATFISYTLFIDEDIQWVPTVGVPILQPEVPIIAPKKPEDSWLKRPKVDPSPVVPPPPYTPPRTQLEKTADLKKTLTNRVPLAADPMGVYNQCHNSIQGRKLVTDDSGGICSRQHLMSNGCCRSSKTLDRMSCGMCRTDVQCCRSYEYCVSCCLSRLPENDRSADSIPSHPRVSFHSFDKCLHLCRTSSRSIRHGNVYRTAVLKHCYTEGEHALPLNFEESTVMVAKQGVSCSRTCASYRGDAVLPEEAEAPGVMLPPAAAPALYICHEAFLPKINTCETMKKYFNCRDDKCETNTGSDQPAGVIQLPPNGAPPLPLPPPSKVSNQPTSVDRSKLPSAQCLINGDAKLFDCDGHHESTNRLCVCIQADKAE